MSEYRIGAGHLRRQHCRGKHDQKQSPHKTFQLSAPRTARAILKIHGAALQRRIELSHFAQKRSIFTWKKNCAFGRPAPSSPCCSSLFCTADETVLRSRSSHSPLHLTCIAVAHMLFAEFIAWRNSNARASQAGAHCNFISFAFAGPGSNGSLLSRRPSRAKFGFRAEFQRQNGAPRAEPRRPRSQRKSLRQFLPIR